MIPYFKYSWTVATIFLHHIGYSEMFLLEEKLKGASRSKNFLEMAIFPRSLDRSKFPLQKLSYQCHCVF
uniref:Uncharacterized protein n=1 Tax=Triticum urartu TaxID=4572 RepID=A0A8R7UR06_TRIUA